MRPSPPPPPTSCERGGRPRPHGPLLLGPRCPSPGPPVPGCPPQALAGEGAGLLRLQPRSARGPGSQPRGPRMPLTFSPLGPESPLRPGSPGGPCGRRVGSGSLPIPPPPLPGAHRGVTHHGPGGAVGAWGSWKTLFTLKHSRLRVSCPVPARAHAAPPGLGHSPQGRGSLAGRQAPASRGPPGGRWGQSSQEDPPSRLPPAGGEHMGPSGRGHPAQTLLRPQHPRISRGGGTQFSTFLWKPPGIPPSRQPAGLPAPGVTPAAAIPAAPAAPRVCWLQGGRIPPSQPPGHRHGLASQVSS